MRLYELEDSRFDANENFYLEIKNGKCYFGVNGDRHVFGSKVYPVGKKASIFTNGFTEEGKYIDIEEAMHNSNWQPRDGYCYTNAEILHSVFREYGIDAKYYSGWLFAGGSYPIHHAWVVVDGNVYDISVNMSAQRLMRKQIDNGRDPYSKECVREVKEFMKNWKPLRENFTWGKVDPTMIYVGAESNPNKARLEYNKAVDDPSTHPSYTHMNKGEKYAKSRYQKALDDI